MSASRFWRHFYEIYEAIPCQGPGDRDSTERALRLLPPLRCHQRILDIGCGVGAQTIDLYRRYPDHFGYGFFVMQRA